MRFARDLQALVKIYSVMLSDTQLLLGTRQLVTRKLDRKSVV